MAASDEQCARSPPTLTPTTLPRFPRFLAATGRQRARRRTRAALVAHVSPHAFQTSARAPSAVSLLGALTRHRVSVRTGRR